MIFLSAETGFQLICSCRNWVSVDLLFQISSSCIYPCSVPQERKLIFMNCIRKFFWGQALTYISSKGEYEKITVKKTSKNSDAFMLSHFSCVQLFVTLQTLLQGIFLTQ